MLHSLVVLRGKVQSKIKRKKAHRVEEGDLACRAPSHAAAQDPLAPLVTSLEDTWDMLLSSTQGFHGGLACRCPLPGTYPVLNSQKESSASKLLAQS